MADETADADGSGRDDRAVVPDGGDVVGERGVDEELHARIEGEDSTIDPAATEKSVETTREDMDTGQSGPEDDDRKRTDRSTGDEGIDLESALSEALEEDDTLERTASGTDHAVGEGDPDDLFEEFEEDSPEEVIQAADEPADTDDDVDISGLFEDLGEVEESTVSTAATAETDAGTETDVEAGAATGGAVEGDAAGGGGEELLLGDSDETAGEVEGLLDDLTTVDVEETGTAGTGTAHTEPTILTSEETRATGFQWLGEDIQIFSSDGDPDAVFDEFAEDSPEEVIRTAGMVTATAVFDDLADGRVAHPETAAETGGWSAGDTTPDGVGATALFDRVAESVEPATTTATVAGVGHDDTPAGETTPAAGDAEPETEDGLDLTVDGAEDADVASAATTEADEGLDLDLDVDLDSDDTAPDGDAEAGTVALDSVEEAESDAGIDVEAPVEETDQGFDFDLDLEESVDATGTESASGTTPEPDPETPDGAVAAESDVDAVFERFDEDSPEELIDAAEADTEPTADTVEPSAERIDELFGDLSAVSLTPVEREEPSEETGAAPEPGSAETVAAIEGLLGGMGPADVPETMSEDDPADEPEIESGEEPTFAADAGDADLGDPEPDVLEQTGEDTHVAVGESDIDAFFERFNESSPEEIAESARVPPLEELSERDPERVREEVGDGHAERTPEVDDSDPVEVLGPDDGEEESLSGAIREDLASPNTETGSGDDRTDGEWSRDGRETGGELSDLDRDDIFAGADDRDDGDRSPVASGSDTDSDSNAGSESPGVTMNGEDLVSDARRGTSGVEGDADAEDGSEARSPGRTNSERVGEALTGDTRAPDPEDEGSETAAPDAGETGTGGEETAESGDATEGILGRILSRLRALF